jgi:hypothetical protein
MSSLAVSEYLEDITAQSHALRHGTLLLASTYHAMWRGMPVPSICHYHSMLTIQCVNSSLETVEGQIADGTFAAIACLAAFEVNLHLLLQLNNRLADSIECCRSCHQIVCPYRWNGSVEKDPCFP